MSNTDGYEMTSINPGWIKRIVPDTYADDDLKRIVIFYVINTPCENLSSSAIPLSQYGWKKDVWKNNKLKDRLFKAASLERNKSFFVAKKTTEMKQVCKKANLSKGFQSIRVERIAVYKPSYYSEFMAVFYHIRNALAHGRLTMYSIPENRADFYFVLEDGLKKNGQFSVRSRMVLKKSTLLRWIDIIENPED